MNSSDLIVKMFADDNDTYEHSDDEEIEEHLAYQCISMYHVKSHSRPLTNSLCAKISDGDYTYIHTVTNKQEDENY